MACKKNDNFQSIEDFCKSGQIQDLDIEKFHADVKVSPPLSHAYTLVMWITTL